MNIKSIANGFLAISFFFSNALAVYAGETNYWADRRVQKSRRFAQSGIPGDSLGGDNAQASLLLAQLPGAQAVRLDGANMGAHSFDVLLPPVGRIPNQDLNAAQTALARDGSADWLDPIVNPYGTVREIYLSKKADSPLIIHIQDVHGYADAQMNIAGMIDGLAKYRGVNLIGLEAAEGAFALEDLRRFPDQDIKDRVSNWAIKKDLIGGAEKSGIMSEKPLTLWGVENTALYQSNVQAVKDSLARRPEVLKFHRELVKDLARLKTAVYSDSLKKYDENLTAYQDHRRGLGDYLRHLAGQTAGGAGELTKKFPNTSLLLNALDQESQLDFKQVERERVSLVERLAARLDEKTLNGLVKESMAYRAGRITYGRYYAYVKDLCHRAKIDLGKFPGLTDYIAYVGLSEKINRDRLLSELEKLEELVATHLARTDTERNVLALSRDSVLLGKLMNNAITPEEWARYLVRRGEMGHLEARIKTHAQQADVPFETKFPQDLAGFVTPFEDFCRLALARDNAMADRLFVKMGEDRIKAAMLVTGGFHTEGLLGEIKRRGGSYVVLTPRVEIVQSDKNYLDAFAHDPVPLEKLFDGEKISILTARTTTSNAGQSGEITGPEKLGLAMMGEMVNSWFAELRNKKRSLHEIFTISQTRLEALRLKLGDLFTGMELKLVDASAKGISLNAKVDSFNYRVSSSLVGGVNVNPSPALSLDGLENAYTRFAKTKFGEWLRDYNIGIFNSVAEVFFAPTTEEPLTENLVAFGKKHEFISLLFTPRGLIAMLVNRSTDWKSLIRSLGGWTGIAGMGIGGFSPTFAAFYFTFLDPAGMFSLAAGPVIFAVVAVVNYAFRTKFYLLPHGFSNAIFIGMNMILAFLNIFFKKLTFRFDRLTLDSPAWLEWFKETEKRILDAQTVITSKTVDWETQTFDNKMEVANYYWDLRSLATNRIFRDYDMENTLIQGGVPSDAVSFFMGIIRDNEFLERINKFDEDNFKKLVALGNLLSAHQRNAGFASVDLNRAQAGFEILHKYLNKATGFYIDRNIDSYLEMRFGDFKDGNLDPIWDRKNGDIVKARFTGREIFMRQMMWKQIIEIAVGLLPGSSANESVLYSNDEEFNVVVHAYKEFWEQLANEFPGLLKTDIQNQQKRLIPFLEVLNLPAEMNQQVFELLNKRTEVESFIAQRREGVEAVYEFEDAIYEFTDTGRKTYNEFTYSAPIQIFIKFLNCEEILVVWVFKGKDLPEKYRALVGSSFDPEAFYVATQRNDDESSRAVAKFSEDKEAGLNIPSYWQEGQRIINGKVNPVATVSLEGGIVKVSVKLDEYVRFGIPIITSNPEVTQKEITFNVVQDAVRPWSDPIGPIVISDDTQQNIADQIQNYIGSLSQLNKDEMLLIEYFKQTGRIVVKVARSFSHGRFRIYTDNTGVGIEIRIQEDEIDPIANGRLFVEPEEERFKGINNLLKALRERDRVLKENPGNYSGILGLNSGDLYDENGSLIRKVLKRAKWRLNKLLHPDKGGVDLDGSAAKMVNNAATKLDQPGASGIFELFGIKNLGLAGVLESLVDLLVAAFYIPVQLAGVSTTGLAELGLAALDITGSLFVILLVGKYFVHYVFGVSQPGDQPAKNLLNTSPVEMLSVAGRATFTASKSLVMLPLLGVAFLAPISAWIAFPVAIAGVLWGTYLHAWSNYLVEVPYLYPTKAAEGVDVFSFPLDSKGNRVDPDPRVKNKGFLNRIFLGGPATPAYESVNQAIYAVHQKGPNGRLAANTGNLTLATIKSNPGAWIANRVLLLEKNNQEEGVVFLNMVVFFSKHLLEMANQQPDGPLLIEVPSPENLNRNSTAQMALAAVLMAHRELTSMDNRPLALVASGEGEQAWESTKEIQTAAFNALQKFAPATVEGILPAANVNVVRATGNLITVEGDLFRYNLANILAQTYVGKNYTSALVLGIENHFNKEGIEVIVRNYFYLAERLANSMRGMILFLTAA